MLSRMAEQDLYAILGLSRAATDDEIRKRYRKLARENHPDVNPGDAAAEERFKQISFAYEILSDAEKRKLFDEFGADGLAKGFDPNQTRAYQRWSQGASRSPFSDTYSSHGDYDDIDDLFSGLFGRGRSRGGPARGRDVESKVTVDFLAAVRGEEVRIQTGDGQTLRVRIPAGSADGSKIRLSGKGHPGTAGAPAGDLYLELHVRPHAFYRREGDDLYIDMPVTLPELVQGAAIDVPTPDGSVSMKLPPHSANGRTLRLRGKGAPKRGSNDAGDLLVRLQLEMPTTDDPRLEELAEEFKPLYGDVDIRVKLRNS